MAWYDGIVDRLDPGDVYGVRQNGRIEEANDALDTVSALGKENSAKNRVLYNDYLSRVNKTYGDTAKKLDKYLENLENTEAYDPGQFEYKGDVNDFYSKAANQRVAQAMNNMTSNAAAAGNMFSSDFQNAMAAKQQAMASEEWDKAYDRYMQDRAQKMNEFNVNSQAGQQAYNNQYNLNKDLLGQASNAQDNIMNAFGSYTSNIAGQNNIDYQNAANIAQQRAANNNSEKSLIGRIFG